MGKSVTPTYRVEFSAVRTADKGLVHWTPMAWNSRQAGRPTAANLATFIAGYEKSTLPYGCNSHLGVTVIGAATIVRQSDGVVVATFCADCSILGHVCPRHRAVPDMERR